MRKKLRISLGLAGLLAVMTVIQVIAGASFDFGELPGAPPAGEANWVAWHREYLDGTPYELLTEDNTNSKLGEDIGYSEYGDGDTNTEWWIQIENFYLLPDTAPFPEPIFMVFGGLGETYSGTLWRYTIDEWIITESATEHFREDVTTFTGDPCPSISEQPVEEPTDPDFGRTFVFSGSEPGAIYHIYRSRNASGAENGASNGQYFWIDTVPFPEGEYGTFYTDLEVFDGPAWYLVIEADFESNAIIGCHSEEADPTAVRVFDFEALYDHQEQVVNLAWKKSDDRIIGFNVLRSTDENDQDPQKINSEMIPAVGEESFTFVDGDLVMGETYYYWIELVDNEGRYDKVGPREVPIDYRIYLPIIHK